MNASWEFPMTHNCLKKIFPWIFEYTYVHKVWQNVSRPLKIFIWTSSLVSNVFPFCKMNHFNFHKYRIRKVKMCTSSNKAENVLSTSLNCIRHLLIQKKIGISLYPITFSNKYEEWKPVEGQCHWFGNRQTASSLIQNILEKVSFCW